MIMFCKISEIGASLRRPMGASRALGGSTCLIRPTKSRSLWFVPIIPSK
jgi:hypothetical protein